MKKIVGISILFLIVKMSHCAQVLTLKSLVNHDINIAKLDEDSVNRLFNAGFKFNDVGYDAFSTLAQRGRARMMEAVRPAQPRSAEKSFLLGVFGKDESEDEERTPRTVDTEQQDFVSALEFTVPSIEITPADLLGELSIDEKRCALRVVRSAQIAGQQSTKLDLLLGNVRTVYNSARENENVRQAMVLGGAVLLTSSYAASQNRSVFANAGGGLSMLPEIIGGAGSALVLFWAYEKYVKIMEGIRLMQDMQKNIGGWVKESKNIKKDFVALKGSYNELKQGMSEAIAVTGEMKEHMSTIVAVSDDHNTLAGIMQMLLQKVKIDEERITVLQHYLLALAQNGNLTDEVQELLKKGDSSIVPSDTLPLTDEEQKAEIVKMYNRPSSGLGKLLGKNPKVAIFDDIPVDWFVKHARELENAKLTIRP